MGPFEGNTYTLCEPKYLSKSSFSVDDRIAGRRRISKVGGCSMLCKSNRGTCLANAHVIFSILIIRTGRVGK